MSKVEIEVWKSDQNREELHHYHNNAYLFGFSTEMLSKKLYKKILKLIKEELTS